ncbi:hypothetical protein E1211_15245 [Micromonospora sp. 15K316]|uniref:hypothetical protein n=1 Tax=unclassified Micromonospora TaxID=2617518 RepID=UPI001042E281|nr:MULTISPECIES: hypothetical protein [unclassified Micromonospora]TDB71800.1 hypothetical protein E1165_21980 [Micromonospora sp. KC723]TDC35661.1 hypothetical protein E1211_15245 [Micromonospora sp. 15K316]
MARLIGPAQDQRVFYYTRGARRGQFVPAGTVVPLYADEDATEPADVLAADGVSSLPETDDGIPYVTIGSTFEAELFRFPDGSDPVVYTRVGPDGPMVPLYPAADGRIDQLAAAVAGSVSGTVVRIRDEAGGAVRSSILGGGSGNAIADDVIDSTIVGGGTPGRENVIGNGIIANVGTTSSNVPADPADLRGTAANHCTVGGYDNVAAGLKSVMWSDHSAISAAATHSTISGGSDHRITGGDFVTISGGTFNTASATQATIAGGGNNTASGQYSFTAGQNNTVSAAGAVALGSANTVSGASALAIGQNNKAEGNYSTAFGRYARARVYGQNAMANHRFAQDGDAQTSVITLARQTTTATATILGIAGGGTAYDLLPSSTVAFSLLLVAREGATADCKSWRVEGMMRRPASGNSAVVGTPVITVLAETSAAAPWTLSVAGSSIGTLHFLVVGEAGKTISWVGRLTLVEVAV